MRNDVNDITVALKAQSDSAYHAILDDRSTSLHHEALFAARPRISDTSNIIITSMKTAFDSHDGPPLIASGFCILF